MKKGSLTLQVTGIDDVLRSLRKLERELPGTATSACVDGAEIIAKLARGNAPIGDSGDLAASIMVQPAKKAAWVRVDAATEEDKEYAGHVEYGTSKMAARPYLRPAIESGKRDAMKAIGHHIKLEIEKR